MKHFGIKQTANLATETDTSLFGLTPEEGKQTTEVHSKGSLDTYNKVSDFQFVWVFTSTTQHAFKLLYNPDFLTIEHSVIAKIMSLLWGHC